MNRRHFLQTITIGSLSVGLTSPALARYAATHRSTAPDLKPVLAPLNALRTDPANARATLDKMVAAAFGTETQTLLTEKYGDKTHAEHLAALVAFLRDMPKMAPLTWDEDLATLAANGGKSANTFCTPEQTFDAFDTDPTKALLWSFLRGVDFHYKPLFAPRLCYGGAGLQGDKLYLTASTLPGKAFTRPDAAVGKNAYDPRLDDAPPWIFSLFVREPNVIPFVRADGTMDVVWRELGSKRLFLTRLSTAGAKVWTKPVPGADADTYKFLMGFSEDKEGNLYIARCVDEAAPSPEIDPPKENPNNSYDRADRVKVTKLNPEGGELWTKNFAKKGGSAGAYFSPLSSDGKGNTGASSRLACITIKRAIYHLAADPSVVVPPQIAEQSLLGYGIDRAGKKSPNRFDPKFQPMETGDVLAPKVKLQFDDRFAQGTVFAASTDPGKLAIFFDGGGVQSYFDLVFLPEGYEKFIAFVEANKQGEGKELYVAPEKLRMKRTIEDVPLVFMIYAGATSYDPDIQGRHQQAYWRALDARTGEPLTDFNNWAMAHSFDSRILVTDEGIITAERSDNFLLLSNYLYTRPGPVFLPAFNSVSDGNESYTQLGGIAPADDGYLLLYTANNNKGLVAFTRGQGLTDAQAADESLKQRDLGVLRVRKGFAQAIDVLSDQNKSEFDQTLDSRQPKTPTAERQFLLLPKYLTTYYPNKQHYSAGRAKIVRVPDGNYVIFWERWTDTVTTNDAGEKQRSGNFDSVWAMKIDKNGTTVLPARQVSDTLRLMRGDDPVLWNGKATFVTGDIVTNTLVVHTLDTNLAYQATGIPMG